MKTRRLRKVSSVILSLAMAVGMMFSTATIANAETPVSATETATVTTYADTSGLVNWINELGDTAKYIGYAISGVAVIVIAIMLIGGGNGSISKVKGAAIGVLGGIALLGFGPAIIQSFADATSGMLVLPFI